MILQEIHAVANVGAESPPGSIAKILEEQQNISISAPTVARILKADGLAPRVNHKQLSTTNHPERDLQFQTIARFRGWADANGIPLISIDTKKKEHLGPFRNPGKAWGYSPVLVYDHDFPSLADGIAIPYGIYDMRANTGAFYVGCSYDTPEFAVDSVTSWWREIGQYMYPHAQELCILADSGGSNGCPGHGPGNSICSTSSPMCSGSSFGSSTIPVEPPNGIRLNTVSSAKSPKIGQESTPIHERCPASSVHHHDKERTHGHRKEGR